MGQRAVVVSEYTSLAYPKDTQRGYAAHAMSCFGRYTMPPSLLDQLQASEEVLH